MAAQTVLLAMASFLLAGSAAACQRDSWNSSPSWTRLDCPALPQPCTLAPPKAHDFNAIYGGRIRLCEPSDADATLLIKTAPSSAKCIVAVSNGEHCTSKAEFGQTEQHRIGGRNLLVMDGLQVSSSKESAQSPASAHATFGVLYLGVGFHAPSASALPGGADVDDGTLAAARRALAPVLAAGVEALGATLRSGLTHSAGRAGAMSSSVISCIWHCCGSGPGGYMTLYMRCALLDDRFWSTNMRQQPYADLFQLGFLGGIGRYRSD
jgi:hypothetical protein